MRTWVSENREEWDAFVAIHEDPGTALEETDLDALKVTMNRRALTLNTHIQPGAPFVFQWKRGILFLFRCSSTSRDEDPLTPFAIRSNGFLQRGRGGSDLAAGL